MWWNRRRTATPRARWGAEPQTAAWTETAELDTNLAERQQVVTSPDNRLTTVTTSDERGNPVKVKELFDGTSRTSRSEYDANDNRTKAIDPLGHETTSTYDESSNLLSTTDPLGRTTRYEYDEHGRPLKTIAPDGAETTIKRNVFGDVEESTDELGRTQRVQYDNAGRPLTITDPLERTATTISYTDGRPTTFTDGANRQQVLAYNAADRLASIRDAGFGFNKFTYDAEGNVLTTTNAQGRVRSFTYDYMGRRLTETDPMLKTKTFVYDAAGRIESMTDRNGQKTTYAYDDAGRLARRDAAGGVTTYDYDGAGRLTTTENADARVELEYDLADRPTRITTTPADGPSTVVSYTYDAAGQRKTMTRDGRTVAYGYDEGGRMTDLDASDSGSFDFAYDQVGRLKTLTRPNGVVTSYTQNAADELLDVVHANGTSVIDETHYGYDGTGRRTSMRDPAGTHSYFYDPVGRLRLADHPSPMRDEDYVYDIAGNRANNFAKYDLGDRLLSTNSWQYTYDNEGRTTARLNKGNNTYLPTPAYDWDAEGRLRKVTGPAGEVTTYRYDPLGRRIEKSGPAGTKRYGYGLDHNPLVELDGQSSAAAYTFGQGLDSPLAMERGQETAYYQQGGLSTVTSLSRSDGSLRNRYSYGAFGQPQAGDATDNPFTYTGREWDAESSTYHYRARQYDPQSGRFVSEDPLPAMNLYPYAENDPISFNDPLGETSAAEQQGQSLIQSTLFQIGVGGVIGMLSPVLCNDTGATAKDVIVGGLLGAAGGYVGGRAIGLFVKVLRAGPLKQLVPKLAAVVIGNAVTGGALYAAGSLIAEGELPDLSLTGIAGALSGIGGGGAETTGPGGDGILGGITGLAVEVWTAVYKGIQGQC